MWHGSYNWIERLREAWPSDTQMGGMAMWWRAQHYKCNGIKATTAIAQPILPSCVWMNGNCIPEPEPMTRVVIYSSIYEFATIEAIAMIKYSKRPPSTNDNMNQHETTTTVLTVCVVYDVHCTYIYDSSNNKWNKCIYLLLYGTDSHSHSPVLVVVPGI